MNRTVLLLSGGLDSAVALARSLDRGDKVLTLSVQYGQKHFKELQAAHAIAEYYGCAHTVVEMPRIFAGVGSKLIEPGLAATVEEAVVPFRNANLLSIATTFALTHGCDEVCMAVHATDAPFPDCTPEFIDAMRTAIWAGTAKAVNLCTPFINWSKAQIVRLGDIYRVPFKLTWSCYTGGAKHCGKCATCIERKKAFESVELYDPTEYEDV